jgi:hypothetical protein
MIGARSGGVYTGSTKTITNEEYDAAVKAGIPCIVCVERNVFAYNRTYKKNPAADHSHIVDNAKVFHFIDNIQSGHADNWMHQFEFIEDIQKILITQFGNYLRIYSSGLKKGGTKKEKLKNTVLIGFPQNLNILKKEKLGQDNETALRNGIKKLHKIISEIQKADINEDSKREKLKTMWIFATEGEFEGECIRMEFDIFKDLAWSWVKGRKVFNQMKHFRMSGSFPEDEGDKHVSFYFVEEDEDNFVTEALVDWTKRLVEKYGEDALDYFKRADMRIYQD